MMTLLLALSLFHHTEHGVVHIPSNSIVTIGFSKPFKNIPLCSADKPVAKFRSVSREWGEIVGPAGERVAWTCK
jgi:hypothetical protein